MSRGLNPEEIDRLLGIADRFEIRECIETYPRGVDRHDDAILRSVFHEDAVDDHGVARDLDEFVYWANNIVHQHLAAHMHHITSHTATVEGDHAHAESYVLFVHRYKDGKTVHVAGGRYLDQLERREGRWGIVRRQVVVDYRYLADGSIFGDWDGYVKGSWGADDPSYRC